MPPERGRAPGRDETPDTLRDDVARDCLRRGRTPNLAAVLPGRAWEKRHSPGTFTFAAHAAFL